MKVPVLIDDVDFFQILDDLRKLSREGKLRGPWNRFHLSLETYFQEAHSDG